MPNDEYRATFHGPNLIWLISYTEDANDVYMCELERCLSEYPNASVTIERVAFGSQSDAEPMLRANVGPDMRLAAAILVLERAGLGDAAYLRWATKCVEQVAQSDDFRLYVGSDKDGTTIDDYEVSVGDDGRKLLEDLVQTVQFTPRGDSNPSESPTAASEPHALFVVPGPHEVCDACVSYLQEIDEIRVTNFWRRLQSQLASVFGSAAFCVQVGALLAIVLYVLTREVFRADIFQNSLLQQPETVGLLVGVILFPINTLPAYFVLRGPRDMTAIAARRPDLMRLFYVLAAVSLGLSVVIGRAEATAVWVLLGIATGGVLDHSRRVAVHGRRSKVSLSECFSDVGFPDRPRSLLDRGTRLVQHPLFMPLFPAIRPRVFISYARRTDWSERTANELYGLLEKQNTIAFHDRKGIAAGSNWNAELNRAIREADLFLVLLEPETVRRRWVATELLAALDARSRAGTPRIVVLTPADMNPQSVQDGFNAFVEVITPHSGLDDGRHPRVLETSDVALKSIASDLRPAHYETGAVIPNGWSLVLRGVTLRVVQLGGLSGFIGMPAIILFGLELGDITNVGSSLAGTWGMIAVCLIGGYFAGFCFRLTMSTFFEMRHRQRKEAGIVHAVVGAGIAALVVQWWEYTSPLIVGWTVVVGSVGWYLAVLFLETSRLVSPESFLHGEK